jgi:hypothetical protein
MCVVCACVDFVSCSGPDDDDESFISRVSGFISSFLGFGDNEEPAVPAAVLPGQWPETPDAEQSAEAMLAQQAEVVDAAEVQTVDG